MRTVSVIFTGWRSGFNAVQVALLLTRTCGMGIKDAKLVVERLLDHEEVRIPGLSIESASYLVEMANSLGAESRIEPDD